MFGNRKSLLVIVFVLLSCVALHAGGRIPAKDFRFGLNIEGGIKFIGPTMFHGKSGFIFKFNETFSLIPYMGIYPDAWEDEHISGRYWNGSEYVYEYNTETVEDVTVDAGITFRFEFPKEIIRRSTSFEYDVEEQKFLHHHYYSAFRPFVQFHVGTFLGGGFGFLYYFTGAISAGLNVDVGYNLAAHDGFGVSPKMVIALSF